MNFRHAIGASLALLAVTAVAGLQDTYTLKRKPAVGETSKYRIKAEIDISGQTAVFTALSQEKIIAVGAEGGYTQETSQLEGKVSIAGQEIEVPDQGASTTVFGPSGDIVEIRGTNVTPSAYRMGTLNNFFEPKAPIKVGDTWTHEIKEDTSKGILAATAEFKLLAVEQVDGADALKIEGKVKEKTGGAAAEYTIWLKKDSAQMVRLDGKWINAPLEGAPGPVNATITIRREG